MTPSALLLCFEEEQQAAQRIATAAGIDLARIERHRFPDGELKLRLPPKLPPLIVLLRCLDHPNEKLIELLLCARTARELGAQHLTLVSPYLAYMRQDMAFRPGEAISQLIIGQFLAQLFDAVITVDPHLHRISELKQAIAIEDAVALSGSPLLAEMIASKLTHPLLIGPDEESAQWVAQAAHSHGFDHAVCRKVRHGDRHVEIELPGIDIKGRAVVLLDDVASSGRTLAGAAQLLLSKGCQSVDVAVTHALFAGDALEVIKAAGVREVWSTDCISHSSNAVSMAPAIAGSLRTILLNRHS